VPDFAHRIYPLNGGHNDARPPYGIGKNEWAVGKNMRVWRGEARTAKGYISSTSSVIRTGVTAIRGLDFAVRADGTEDLVAVSDSGYWKLVGDTKTLISAGVATGQVTVVDASVTGNSGGTFTRFAAEITVGDLFWLTADGIANAVEVATISGTSAVQRMTLSANYGGATTGAASYSVWRKQTDARTRTLYWLGRWFFANGTDYLQEWDGTTFREVGMTARWDGQIPFTSTTATGGSLGSATQYEWRYVLEDSRGKYGAPAWPQLFNFTKTTAEPYTSFTLTPDVTASVPTWVSGYRMYRASGEPLGSYYYMGRLDITATFTDDGTLSASTTATAPSFAQPPPAGFEDLAVIDQRLAAISGRTLYISGQPPTDQHTDTAGRAEPESWTVTHVISDGEVSGGYSFLSIRGRTYILGSRDMYVVNVNSDDPAVWTVLPFMPNIGCASRWSIANGGDVAYWVGRYRGRMTVLAFDGQRIQDIGRGVHGILDAMDLTKLDEIQAGVGHGFYWATIPGSTYKVIEFNTDAGEGIGTWGWRDWQVQSFAQAVSKAYGAFENGLVNELESGSAKAGATQAYQLDTAGIPGAAPEWPSRFQSAQIEFDLLEFDLHSGSPVVSASTIVDDGSAVAMPNSPVAISATPIFREGLGTAVYGQRAQIRLEAEGTDVDFTVRGVTLKGDTEDRDVS
jgi:hypothetical protein